MNYVKGFFFSLLLHGLAAGIIIFSSMNMGAPDKGKRTVDISMIMIDAPVGEPSAEEVFSSPPPPPAPPEATRAPEPKPELIKESPQKEEISYKNAEPELEASGRPEMENNAAIDGTEDNINMDEAGASGGVEGGAGGLDEENTGKQAMRAAYMRDNYSYIQKRIKDKLLYPSHAKRTGAEGRVTVVFTINEDGTASDIYVEKSSGHKILDTAAVDTIKAASPFRKPPLPAQIAIPIDFELR